MTAVAHADTPFREAEEARIYTIAQSVAETLIEELASRGALGPIAAEVLSAIQARNYGQQQIARFPHREKANG